MIEFENGSKISSIDSTKYNGRGRRANIIYVWNEETQDFDTIDFGEDLSKQTKMEE